MSEPVLEAPPSLELLAERLDCMTEAGLTRLADITPLTAETWRKRREGPTFVRAGNRVLYPRAAVAEWLASKVRECKPPSAKGQL